MSTEEFAKSVIDIDSDGKSELVIELEEYPGGIQIVMVDGVNKVVSMEVFEDGEIRVLEGANFTVYETKDKINNEITYFLSEYMADGPCYERKI